MCSFKKVWDEEGKEGVAELTKERVREATGGVTDPFERFRKLKDGWFRGECAKLFMELNEDDDEEE